MNSLENVPNELLELKNPPKNLYFKGNLELLKKRKIAIVGSRKPNPYTKVLTQSLGEVIAKSGGVVVSGGALGVDIIAHQGAHPNTIMVAPTDLNHYYPTTNKRIIESIYNNALALSEYSNIPKPFANHFLERNRLVIALSEAVIIPQADLKSGSMESAKIATKLNKPIYVLPQRMGESDGTNHLLHTYKAKLICNIQEWASEYFGSLPLVEKADEILEFIKSMPTLEEAIGKFGDKIYEYELEGKIGRKNGVFYVL